MPCPIGGAGKEGDDSMNFPESAGTSEKIYLLMAQRLREVQEELPCTLDALRAYAAEGRAEIDYLKLINLDNRSFLDAVYTISFNTVPPASYVETWERYIEELPKEKFQRKFMNTFVRRRDFAVRHVRLRNCICLDQPGGDRYEDYNGKPFKERIFQTLRPVYLKLPKPAREKLKTIFWNYFFLQ